jgi:hypothetical protein
MFSDTSSKKGIGKVKERNSFIKVSAHIPMGEISLPPLKKKSL